MAVTRLDPALCASSGVPQLSGECYLKNPEPVECVLGRLAVVENRSEFPCYPRLLEGAIMSLHITIDGQGEAIVRAQLAQGNARSPEELVELALQAYSRNGAKRFFLGASRKSSAEAVADIHELRNTVSLGGLKIKDLTHEGHKY